MLVRSVDFSLHFCLALSPPLEVTISPNEPDPFAVQEGNSATFRCSVPAGTSISTIAWSQNSGEALTGITQITNGLLLTVTADSKESDVLYTCTVVDAAGTNSSQSIRVTVTSKKYKKDIFLGIFYTGLFLWGNWLYFFISQFLPPFRLSQ